MLENIQGDSWGSILPLRMPSLLPHDLCHEWNASPAPGRSSWWKELNWFEYPEYTLGLGLMNTLTSSHILWPLLTLSLKFGVDDWWRTFVYLCVFVCVCVCGALTDLKNIWRLIQFARQWGNSEQTAPQSLSPGYLHLTASCNKIVVSNFFRFYIYSQVELLTSAKSFPETQSLLNLELCIFLNKAHLFLLLESHFSVIFLFTCLIYQTMVLI